MYKPFRRVRSTAGYSTVEAYRKLPGEAPCSLCGVDRAWPAPWGYVMGEHHAAYFGIERPVWQCNHALSDPTKWPPGSPTRCCLEIGPFAGVRTEPLHQHDASRFWLYAAWVSWDAASSSWVKKYSWMDNPAEWPGLTPGVRTYCYAEVSSDFNATDLYSGVAYFYARQDPHQGYPNGIEKWLPLEYVWGVTRCANGLCNQGVRRVSLLLVEARRPPTTSSPCCSRGLGEQYPYPYLYGRQDGEEITGGMVGYPLDGVGLMLPWTPERTIEHISYPDDVGECAGILDFLDVAETVPYYSETIDMVAYCNHFRYDTCSKNPPDWCPCPWPLDYVYEHCSASCPWQ